MRKLTIALVGLLFAVSCSLQVARAQEESKPAPEGANVKTNHSSGLPGIPGTPGDKPKHAYRVDFSINELDNGKKMNTRHYSMILTSGDRNQVKIGTRVPVSTPQMPLQYLDVGTLINCRIVESSDDLSLEVHSDFSSLSSPDEQRSSQPVIRQVTVSGTTLTAPGKSVVIGAADDPNSNRQFQLEATVTKLK